MQILTLLFCCTIAFAQNSGRVTLPGHIHAGVTSENDQGRVPASLTLQHMSIFLQPTAAQQADLTSFLAQQQDPNSPNYHKWLTPEQYADRFGASKQDVAKVVAWLKSENMTAIDVARGQNEISFTGPVRDVESAFGTEIHYYMVNGEKHYANATEPSVPASLKGLIMSIRGLNDFRMKPHAMAKKAKADYTSGASGYISVGPGDIATIYDVNPLLNSGISGTGMKIAIAGQTDIVLSDIAEYRAFYNLPANVPQVILIPNSKDPGVSTSGDLVEADLDIELAGAVARNATIIFVNSTNVSDSATYAIENNLAPVLSMSYGDCEAVQGNAELASLNTLAQQANAQGMTWIAASGDNGAADCYMSGVRGNANDALAVDAPGSVPYVTSLGGTEFNEGSGTYWATANNANHASALSYIPEMVWNDSAEDGQPSASGGGASSYFSKPSWQAGTGVPADGARDVPDLALAASDDHDPMLIYSGGGFEAVGGTSCAAPAFAGMAALLNQYLVANGFESTPGLGNMNPRLYALATAPGVFHDITVGNNIVNGCEGVRGCTGGSIGYNATVGYDQTTGLGSVDLFNLATTWPQTTTTKSPVTLTLTSNAATLVSPAPVTLTATVASTGTTPTGTVTFYSGGTSLGSVTISGTTASLTVQTTALPLGLVSISAAYSGDNTHAAAAASLNLTVNSTTVTAIQGIVNAASGYQAFSPGAIISIYGSVLAGSTVTASTVPLPTSLGGASVTINGTAAPLYYASPGQLNVQIPYSVSATVGVGTVVVTYNNATATAEIPIDTAAPGVFVNYTTGAPAGVSTAALGQEIAIYITGAGAVSPTVTTGSTPTGTTVPTPTQSVSITLGGATVSGNYAYIGVPVWSIGVIQINFTVPTGTPLGSQPIVVTIGGATSAPVNILVTQ